MEHNLFDHYHQTDLTPEQEAEVQKYFDIAKDLRREDAEFRVQELARQIMGYSSALKDDDGSAGANPYESVASSQETARTLAEQIHRRIAESRHGH